MRSLCLAIAIALLAPLGKAQLVVDGTMTPSQLMTDVLLGGGVTVSNITYNGLPAPAAPQEGSGSFTAIGTGIGIDAGIILASGYISSAIGPADDVFSGDFTGTGSDADLESISGSTINDKAVLEFDFIPTGDSLRFRYVFASEEYPIFVCSDFNDAFGFFLSGPGINGPYSNNAINIALIPGTNIPVTINSVNSGTPGGSYDAATCALTDPNWQDNSIYFVDNAGGEFLSYGGYTVVLEASALVQCGETYHIKLAIADALDSSYDSAVFLEAGSFASTGQVIPSLEAGIGVVGNTMTAGCSPIELIFTRMGDLNNQDTITISTSGTAVAGTDYSPALPDQLIFIPGQEEQSVMLDVPDNGSDTLNMVINITQLIECAGSVVETEFEFLIVTPPPLTVELEDISSACGEEHELLPVVSGGVGAYGYQWSTGDTTEAITVSPGITTEYVLTVTDGCSVLPEQAMATVTLPVYPPLELTVSDPLEIECQQTDVIGVIEVSGGDGNFMYQWSPPGLGAGNTAMIEVEPGAPTWYVVTVSEGCGSSIQDSVLVSIAPLPPLEVTASTDVTVICPGDTALLEIMEVIGGNGNYSYEWTAPNGELIGGSTSIQVPVNSDQTYMVTVLDECFNEGTAEANVVLPIYQPLSFSLPADPVICAGDSVDLFASVTGGSGYYFVDWHDLQHTDPYLIVSPDVNTEFIVTVTDQCGATITDEVEVLVEHVSVDINEHTRGLDDWYLQAITTPEAQSWIWEMGDGTRYREPEVVHSYMDLEEHWVLLEVTTANGCTGIDSVLLRSPAQLYFPNAFTPDGDGHNDQFGPKGVYIEEFEMMVFDRWGELIYQTQDMQQLWDGTYKGTISPTGIYTYRYRASGHLFPTIEGFGHVTLLQGDAEQ